MNTFSMSKAGKPNQSLTLAINTANTIMKAIKPVQDYWLFNATKYNDGKVGAYTLLYSGEKDFFFRLVSLLSELFHVEHCYYEDQNFSHIRILGWK